MKEEVSMFVVEVEGVVCDVLGIDQLTDIGIVETEISDQNYEIRFSYNNTTFLTIGIYTNHQTKITFQTGVKSPEKVTIDGLPKKLTAYFGEASMKIKNFGDITLHVPTKKPKSKK